MQFGVREDRNNRLVFKEAETLPTKLQQVFRTGFLSYMGALKKRANREILHGPKTGRIYVIRTATGRRKRHRASAPGETHANRSGRLRRSLSWKVYGWQRAAFGYGVAVKASEAAPRYARFVEHGTRKMEPRPSLANAIEKEEVQGHFDRAFDKVFR